MRIASVIAAVMLAVVAAPAPGAPNEPAPPTRRVSYADLDLTRAEGVRSLKRRLNLAVEFVCGSYAGAAPDQERAIRRCRTDAMPRAEARMAVLIARAEQTQRVAGR